MVGTSVMAIFRTSVSTWCISDQGRVYRASAPGPRYPRIRIDVVWFKSRLDTLGINVFVPNTINSQPRATAQGRAHPQTAAHPARQYDPPQVAQDSPQSDGRQCP